jgi:hypothetical protein
MENAKRMIEIERRPLHPNHVPTYQGMPLDGWIVMYTGRGSGDVAAGRVVNGRIDVQWGRIASRMIAADSGRIEFALVRDPHAERVYVLGSCSDAEAFELLGIPLVVKFDEAAPMPPAEVLAELAAAAEGVPGVSTAPAPFGVHETVVETEPTADVSAAAVEAMQAVDASIEAARAKAADLGIIRADIVRAAKADLVATFELLGLPVDKSATVPTLKAALITALGFEGE